MTDFFKDNGKGLLLCLAIAIPSWILGILFPIIGGAIFAIISGMIVTLFIKNKTPFAGGIRFCSKKVLQAAVVLLGFGLNLRIIAQTGKESLPIILCTIATSLITAYVVSKIMHIPSRISTLIGVGSSICGGSAIAATAPVINATDEEVAQSISVIFFFNVLAAIIFPIMGSALGMDHGSGTAFGIFAGTAVNDTSSVTAAAATWDSMWNLGSATLDKAVTVKLTRTLAIIPITVVLAFWTGRKQEQAEGKKFSIKDVFPMFIVYFVLASIITTVLMSVGVPAAAFNPIKTLSKFCIVLAMAAIGLHTNIVHLIKTGGKPIVLGAICWAAITAVCLAMQHLMGHM